MELNDFFDARARLDKVIHRIPLEFSNYFSKLTGGKVFLKCENLQKTGSFKVRGAYNKIAKLQESKKPKAVVACSAGNHAQGVAFAATKAGIKSTIVMPTRAPLVKVDATASYGASVVLHGNSYDDSYIKAREIEKQTGAIFVTGFDDYDVVAGAGTIGLEILEELVNVNTIVVPAGGGGLLAGIAAAVKQINPKIRIVGVQSEGATALITSYKTGTYTTTDKTSTIADGIAVGKPGVIPYELIKQYVDEMVTVSDDEVADALVILLERCKQVVEPSGAVSVAAILSGKVDVKGQNVCCILSGGNIDLDTISKLIQRFNNKREEELLRQKTLGCVQG